MPRKRSTQEIENDAEYKISPLLNHVFRYTDQELRINPKRNERDTDIVADVQMSTSSSVNDSISPQLRRSIHVQCKGTDKILTIRKRGKNKDFAIYQMDSAKQLARLLNETQKVNLIIVADLKSDNIYWFPVLLQKNKIQERVHKTINDHESGLRKSQSFELPINPDKILQRNGKLIKKNIQPFLADLKATETALWELNIAINSPYLFEQESITIEDDDNLPVIDRLYNYLQTKFAHYNCIKNFYFTDHPVFSLDRKQSRVEEYTLNLKNKSLFTFFSAIKITQKGNVTITDKRFKTGVVHPRKKLNFIIRALNNNLIYYVRQDSSSELVRIQLPTTTCSCPICILHSGKLANAHSSLMTAHEAEGNNRKLAYWHSGLGSYQQSASILVDTFKTSSDKQEKFFGAIISQQLLFKLQNWYWGESSPKETIAEIRKIDAYGELLKNGRNENRRTNESLINSQFLKDARLQLTKSVENLTNSFHLATRGGWSENNDIYYLCYQFSYILAFCRKNYLPFDCLPQGKEIGEVFTVGLFTWVRTHSLHSKQQTISSNLVDLVCRFCDSDFLDSVFKNLEIESLVMTSSTEYDLFIDKTISFVNEVCLLNEDFDKQHKFFCKQTYNVFIETLKARITIARKLPIPDTRSTELFNSLYLLFLSGSAYKSSIAQIFIDYMQAVARFLPTRTLNKAFRLYIKTKELHTDSFLWQIKAIADELPSKAIGFNKTQVAEVLKSIEGVCSECNTTHDSSHLIPLYFVAKDKTSKHQISSAIHSILDTRFDRRLFYLVSIYDIIEPTTIRWQQFVAQSIPPKDKVFPRWETSRSFKDVTDYRIDQMLNLHWKTGLPVSRASLQKIEVISLYYEWLLNPDDFDYGKFNPKWVLHYNTTFFLDCYKGKDSLLNALSSFLEMTDDKQIKEVHQLLS